MTTTERAMIEDELAKALKNCLRVIDYDGALDADPQRVVMDGHNVLARYEASKQSDKPDTAQDVVTEPTALDYWTAECNDLHPATSALIWNFALALSNKLADAEKKYGYTDGWRAKDWEEECRAKLREHVEKGDPRDVAAYCAFMWSHGWSTAAAPAQPQAEVPGWRPIETAPRDNTRILVYENGDAYIAWWTDSSLWRSDQRGLVRVYPRAWMPLPAPPRELAAAQARGEAKD